MRLIKAFLCSLVVFIGIVIFCTLITLGQRILGYELFCVCAFAVWFVVVTTWFLFKKETPPAL